MITKTFSRMICKGGIFDDVQNFHHNPYLTQKKKQPNCETMVWPFTIPYSTSLAPSPVMKNKKIY